MVISPKGLRWHQSGHPWVYRDDVPQHEAALSGQIVQVFGPKRQLLGQAFYHAKSKIALRFLTPHDETIGLDFWRTRIEAAIRYRQQVVQETTAYRLVSSEADGLPGLIIDRYGEALVIQTLALGMDRLKSDLVSILLEILKPQAIVERNDSGIRRLEGLEETKTALHGAQPSLVECVEGKSRYLVDVWNGQKTGAYLDQRENRLHACRYLKNRDVSGFRSGFAILDGFCYTGGFSLHLAKEGGCEIDAVDANAAAVELLKQNLALNQLTNIHPIHANLFDHLKAVQQERAGAYDLVILDPPAFAKSKGEVAGAARGYKELNLRAMKLLKAGGILITCSCSYNFSEDLLLSVLRDAARDVGRRAILLEKRTQSRDHPILLAMPETHYLKCFVLQVF